jgi:hypothetical protein
MPQLRGRERERERERERGVDLQLHSLSTPARDGNEWLTPRHATPRQATAALSPGKISDTRFREGSIDFRAELDGNGKHSLTPPEFKLHTEKPVSSRYTNYVIPAPGL